MVPTLVQTLSIFGGEIAAYHSTTTMLLTSCRGALWKVLNFEVLGCKLTERLMLVRFRESYLTCYQGNITVQEKYEQQLYDCLGNDLQCLRIASLLMDYTQMKTENH